MLDEFLGKILDWFDSESNILWLKSHIIHFIIIVLLIVLLVCFLRYISSKRRRSHLMFHIHHLIYKLGFRRTMSRHWVGRTHVMNVTTRSLTSCHTNTSFSMMRQSNSPTSSARKCFSNFTKSPTDFPTE